MAKCDPGWQGYPTWQTGQPAYAGYPTYHVNMIKLKWEIIWRGGLPHLGGLTHLPGVLHLHVNRPLLAKCWPLVHVIRMCSWKRPDVVAGISARFSNFAFVNDWSPGEQRFRFPRETKFTVSLGTKNPIQCKCRHTHAVPSISCLKYKQKTEKKALFSIAEIATIAMDSP